MNVVKNTRKNRRGRKKQKKVVEQQNNVSTEDAPVGEKPHFNDLPNEILMEIFGYLTFQEVCEKRVISPRWNVVGKAHLHKEFERIQMYMDTALPSKEEIERFKEENSFIYWYTYTPENDAERFIKEFQRVVDTHAKSGHKSFMGAKCLDIARLRLRVMEERKKACEDIRLSFPGVEEYFSQIRVTPCRGNTSGIAHDDDSD